jgi:putative tryptophan/tyrosine transport system substrate-binding protein
VKRRDFITLLGGAAAWPLAARAQQQSAKVARIGFLGLAPAAAWSAPVEALRARLHDLGYMEGKNVVIEWRWAENVNQLSELATQLVHLGVDVIFAYSSTEVEAARQATRTIPIVFAVHADPVGIGHVASLPRPGGNITGLSDLLTDVVAKQLEMLKEAMPLARRIGVLWNPSTPSHQRAVPAVQAAGEKLGLKLRMVPVGTAEEFDAAFSTMTRERVSGFLAVSSPLTNLQRAPLAELALKHRLPGIFSRKENVEAGGLMSYGADRTDLWRRSAVYIDKILKGARPADLPVEQASIYQLVINLRTAKVLGVQIPPTLLARADEVIE